MAAKFHSDFNLSKASKRGNVAHVGGPVGADGLSLEGFLVAAELGTWRESSRLFVRPSITIRVRQSADN
jgi:hypothetical protein